MKIEAGKKYLCIKDVVIKQDGKIEFSTGHTYRSHRDGYLINNSGSIYHSCPDGWWQEFFEETPEYVWGEEVEYRNGGRWERGIFVGMNPNKSSLYPYVLSVGGQISCKTEIRKPVLELTKQEIADKFQIKLEQLKIVD